MSYLDWHVGMKVVRISKGAADPNHCGYGDEILPETDQIYTIRELRIAYGDPVLRLVEIVNQPRLYTCDDGIRETEIWFRCSHFRPVQSRKTDISVFTKLLNPAPKQTEPA